MIGALIGKTIGGFFFKHWKIIAIVVMILVGFIVVRDYFGTKAELAVANLKLEQKTQELDLVQSKFSRLDDDYSDLIEKNEQDMNEVLLKFEELCATGNSLEELNNTLIQSETSSETMTKPQDVIDLESKLNRQLNNRGF